MHAVRRRVGGGSGDEIVHGVTNGVRGIRLLDESLRVIAIIDAHCLGDNVCGFR